MEKKKNVAVEYIRSTLASVWIESRKSDHPKEQVKYFTCNKWKWTAGAIAGYL